MVLTVGGKSPSRPRSARSPSVNAVPLFVKGSRSSASPRVSTAMYSSPVTPSCSVIHSIAHRCGSRRRPTAFQNDLERGCPGGVGEGVIGLHDVVETESMRDEPRGTKLASLHQFEQQWRRDAADERSSVGLGGRR